MKKLTAFLLCLALWAAACCGSLAESGEPSAEWTVMLYLCGSDLESGDFALATSNLRQIAKNVPPESVNLVVETGGAARWQADQDPGIAISADRLQRWAYGKGGFVLVDEQKEACMSHADTLSGFIRWSAENYPAKKHMLILWDHGGGSCGGLLADENYDTIMPLYSLERALRDGGTHFDLLLTDACLMASLETCQAVAPYADYLAASEEIMAGDGTNYEAWFRYLCGRPDCTGRQLGKQICDLSQQYFVEKGDDTTTAIFTMSLIDLSKIGPVVEATEAFLRAAAGLAEAPDEFYRYARATYYVDNYELKEMCDLFDLTRRAEEGGIPAGVTHAVQDAIEEAVVCNLRSPYHSYSHGLSIWYNLNADSKTLDHFARCCKNPEQLAFLDAVSLNWEAPEWVYEKAERHPELSRLHYFVKPVASLSEDGTAAYMTLETGEISSVSVSYELMYKDPATGTQYTLGENGGILEEIDEEAGKIRYVMNFDGSWPTLAGVPLCMEMADDTENYALYNVTVRVNDFSYRHQLRIAQNYGTPGAEEKENGQDQEPRPEFELKGVWDGFDSHSGLPGRNVFSLKELTGMSLTLYRKVFSAEAGRVADSVEAKKIQVTDGLQVVKAPLPKGQYLYRFVVRNVFGDRIHSGELKPVNWDGKNVSFPAEE